MLPNPVGSSTGSSSTANPASALTPDADLARVVELWPLLSPAIRAAVLVLVNTFAPAPATPKAGQVQDDCDTLSTGYE